MQCKCFSVEGILDFDLTINNLQSLGCIDGLLDCEVVTWQPIQSGFLRTKKIKPRF